MDKKTQKAVAFLATKVAILAVVALVMLRFVLAVRICRSADMYPSVRDGDLVLLLRTQDVAFDDVILYEHDGIEYLGRVVAIGGERVTISDTEGFLVDGNVAYGTLPYETRMPEGGTQEFDVGDGEVFVLGDFRDGSRDSREFGCVSRTDVIGRQIYLMRWRGF